MMAFAGWSSLPFLPVLDVPVLIMADDDDQLVPAANSRLLHNAIPHSRLEVFAGGGHLFMLSDPHGFSTRLRDFLNERTARKAA